MRTLLLLALSVPCIAQHKAFDASVAAMVAGTSLDAASSYGRPELNPLLASNGQFQAKGLAIKYGITLGTVWVERKLLPNHPKLAKPFTVFNFIAAGTYSGVAVRNWRQ